MLEKARLTGKYPLIMFDVSFKQLRLCDPTFQTVDAVAEVQTQSKYEKEDEIVSCVDL